MIIAHNISCIVRMDSIFETLLLAYKILQLLYITLHMVLVNTNTRTSEYNDMHGN